MAKLYSLLFGIILVFTIFTRFTKLGQLPSGLNWDEISHGYNAYSVLKTGQDQWGVKWPIFNFRAYGDYPTTANLYLTIPFISLFGLNAFSIRLPAAILGVLFVLLNYYFAKLIFNNKLLAVVVMFVAAISPWTIFPSRGVFQSNLSQVLLLAGLYLFFLALKKSLWLLPSFFAFGLSMYAYHNTRIAAPLIVLTLIIFYYKKLNKKYLVLSSLLFLIIAIPNIINLFSPTSAARNRWVGIINPTAINLINEQRRLFAGPTILNRAINNKLTYFVKAVSYNYLNLVNPIPIFWQGSQNYQFNPPNTPLIFLIYAPFFYFGIFKIIQKKYYLLIVLFLITLLPAALTTGDFPSIRATIALPFYFLFIGYGLTSLTISRFKLFWIIILLISLFQLKIYWQKYLDYNYNYSQNWQYGYQEAVDYLKSNYLSYDNIFFTKKYGEPHEFILFYWPWDPNKFLSDPYLTTDFHADWYWVDRFDKFSFINDWEIKTKDIPTNSLLITSPSNYPTINSHHLKTIYFLNGQPAFDIIAYD